MNKAEAEINKGLSPAARFILGGFSGLFGVLMISAAPSDETALYVYAFGIFCLLICVACVTSGRLRQLVGSIIGCILFALSVWYLVSELTGGNLISNSRSEPSALNAVFFVLGFGVPGIAYAIRVKFGTAKAVIPVSKPKLARR